MVVRNSFNLHSFCMILPKFALCTESLHERYKSTRTKVNYVMPGSFVCLFAFFFFLKRGISVTSYLNLGSS